MGSLQLKAEGSPTPVPEVGTFERSVTSRPTLSSQYLYFTITYWGNQFWKHQKAPDRSQEPMLKWRKMLQGELLDEWYNWNNFII